MLLDLPQAVRLRDGDGLALEDGGMVRVCARPEPLLEIHAHDDGETGAHRLASRQPPSAGAIAGRPHPHPRTIT